ncbi:hypothetical protein DFP72DRAFT_1064296 [Ephemerocybe angulata]|uniref:Uncharacterized protein n=1 Tax=Ephemerocybe angulata TaxID=980116 RepID=A0A8H6M7J8_9AGAR|nr:hypothetical protein DFP72DRAFT_1064296 [Tulosesus angulatus]
MFRRKFEELNVVSPRLPDAQVQPEDDHVTEYPEDPSPHSSTFLGPLKWSSATTRKPDDKKPQFGGKPHWHREIDAEKI